MKIRVFTAILVCKIVRRLAKLFGRGSSLPGKYALKICPDILSNLKLPELSIPVTGSNGKTSTVEMIAHVLKSNGLKVAYNKEGSNQIEGVVTFLVGDAKMSGKVKSDVILLENTRFRKEETKNEDAFSQDLASIADVFVNDAFGTAHRAHCSNVGVTKYVDTCVVGYLMEKEIAFLGNAVENPVRPFVAILGGAKVADKLNVIDNLLEKCDTLIIGGGMAYTFLKAKGYEIGKSLLDETKIDYCKEMMAKAEKLGKKLLLPVDAVLIDNFPDPIDDPSISTEVVDTDKIPADREGADIGPKTIELYSEAVKTAKTVVWNGPMGVFENPVLAKGTKSVAAALAETDATTIIGGGDSAAAVNQLGYGDKMSHISTGGGASLEFLEGKELPGVAAANDK